VFQSNYTISSTILKNIAAIEAAKALIDNAPLVPSWENQFREDAQIRTVHHGTHLEGNDLSLNQAKKIMEGEKIIGKSRDIQEVLNYHQVLAYIDKLQQKEKEESVYTKTVLKKIHSLTTYKLLLENECGKYREKKVVVKDSQSKQVVFIPPLPIEVPYQIEEFFTWLNSIDRKATHPVLRAGIAHYEIVRIHPFIDGNGRVARAFATLILFKESYDIKKFFSLEEYYDSNALNYYKALQSVQVDSSMTHWLEYFTLGLAVELEKVKEKVEGLSLDTGLKNKLGKQIALSPRQIKMVRYLKEHNRILMGDAKKILPMVSDDTLLRDFRDLMNKGIIVREGRTKGVVYRLVG
jgi:Fic family protein